MSATPSCMTRALSFIISRLCMSSRFGRMGSRLKMLPFSYGLMCSPRANSSPSLTVQKESFRFTVPALMDLTSVPKSSMPAS